MDGKHPRRLGGVQDEQQAVAAAEIPDEADVRQVPGKVGAMGADHGPGVGPPQPGKGAVVQPSPPVRRDKVHRRSLLAQAVQGPQDRVVLPVGGDDMVPRPQQAGDGDVQRHSGVGRERHTLRPRRAEQVSELSPDGVDAPGSRQGLVMGAPAAVAVAFHGGRHSLRHTGRLGTGGGGVIQIDHGLMTFPAPASFSTMVYILVTEPTASCSVRP